MCQQNAQVNTFSSSILANTNNQTLLNQYNSMGLE